MADKELSALTAAGALGGTETLYLVDASGNSRKIALSDLKTFINTDPSVVPSSVPWRGARVVRTSNVSISNNSATTVTWQSATLDTDTIWSSGTPTRLTVPTGVTKVRLRAGVRFDASATGYRQLFMSKNGVSFSGKGNSLVSAGDVVALDLNASSGTISVSAGDYFECGVYQTSGGNLNVLTFDGTWFEMEIVEASA